MIHRVREDMSPEFVASEDLGPFAVSKSATLNGLGM